MQDFFKKIKSLKNFLPIVRLRPFNTLQRRFVTKFLQNYVFRHPISAALPKRSHGSKVLQLRIDTPLGTRGTLIKIPKDRNMYLQICRTGSWETDQSVWLAQVLDSIDDLPGKKVLLDIGANVGLISKQVANLSRSDFDLLLVEPRPVNVLACKFNFNNVGKSVKYFEFGLSTSSQKTDLFVEQTNQGNASIHRIAMPGGGMWTTESITLVSTTEFFETFLENYSHIIIKCDTQANDVEIISSIPRRFWEKIHGIVFECWSLENIDSDQVDRVIKFLRSFNFVNLKGVPNSEEALNNLKTFLLSNSQETTYFYACRSEI